MSRLPLACGALLSLMAQVGCVTSNRLGLEVAIRREPGHPEVWVGATRRPTPIVVFVEGDGGDCQAFSEGRWRRFLTRWTGAFTLIRPRTATNDACGTPAFSRLDFAQRVEELGRLVAQVAEPVFLVGHSAGAHVALLYASAHPERVRGIVNLAGGLDALDLVLLELGHAEAVRALKGTAPDGRPFWKRTYAFWRQMAFNEVGRAWRQPPVPVLVLHGEEDRDVVPVSLVRRSAAACSSAVRVEFLPGLGHDLQSDKRVWSRIDAWLAAQSSP